MHVPAGGGNLIRGGFIPLYVYRCEKCGEVEELSKDILKNCPKCGKEVKLILSPISLQFNGSGFYSTDYRGKIVS
jgi:putative FmdB family regulatory protein